MSYEKVEEAWQLSEAARDYVKAAGHDVSTQEIFEKVFLPSNQVDVEKTKAEGGNPPKVFLKSPYGLQFRPEYKDWIPFRHGPVTLEPLNLNP